MSKQLHISGMIEDAHAEIDEAVEELARAKLDSKRAAARVATASAVLTQRCIDGQVARYGGRTPTGHERFKIDLVMPPMMASVKFLGVDDDE